MIFFKNSPIMKNLVGEGGTLKHKSVDKIQSYEVFNGLHGSKANQKRSSGEKLNLQTCYILLYFTYWLQFLQLKNSRYIKSNEIIVKSIQKAF